MKRLTIKIVSAVIATAFICAVLYLVLGLCSDYRNSLLSPVAIYSRARVSFLLILAGTLAALILLVFQSFEDKKDAPQSDIDDISFSNDIANTSDIISEHSVVSDKDSENPIDCEDKQIATDSEFFSDSDTIEFVDKPEKKASDDSDYESLKTDASLDTLDAQLSSLSSADQLEKSLDEELSRAAASEQDVSLVLIRIKGLEHGNDASTQIVSLLTEKCGNQGQFFEYASDGYALIIRNTTLDSALASSENIESSIQRILSDSGIRATSAIGIASRTQRLISGSRLITEADQAVSHALEDTDSPIIAFRVDPEKYRKYLAENGKAPSVQ